MKYWVCYDYRKIRWFVCRETDTPRDTRRRPYATFVEARRRVRRLRKLSIRWSFIAVIRRLMAQWTSVEEFYFTEDQFQEMWGQVYREAELRRQIKEIRAQARQVGLHPDDVVWVEGKWPNTILHAGKALRTMGLDWFDRKMGEEQPSWDGTIQVGQKWRPIDPRRKNVFEIRQIAQQEVLGHDGRKVSIARLLKRYERVY